MPTHGDTWKKMIYDNCRYSGNNKCLYKGNSSGSVESYVGMAALALESNVSLVSLGAESYLKKALDILIIYDGCRSCTTLVETIIEKLESNYEY